MTNEHLPFPEHSDGSIATDDGAPLVSVIIPTHDVREWVAETLQSVLAQEISMEVIVVDDHSTDGTDDYVEQLAERDPRVRLIRATTRGGGSARNAGIDASRGRYLVFCDGDDLVPTGSYRALVGALEASGSDIAFGNFLKFSPTRTWKPTANWPDYQRAAHGLRLDDHASLILGRACWNKAFRRSFWNGAGIRFPDVPRSNDIVPMVTAYLAAERVDVIDENVYLYRERPGTSSMTANAESVASMLSYLSQEDACARAVVERGDERLLWRYASLVMERDGWVHLTKYLRQPLRDPRNDEAVRDAFATLLDRIGPAAFVPREAHKSVVVQLFLDGRWDAASTVSRLMSGPEPTPLEQLDCVVTLLSSPGAGDLIAEHGWLRDRVRDAVAVAVLEAEPLTDLVASLRDEQALLRTMPDLGLRSVPECADADVSVDELAERLTRTRAADAAIVGFRPGSTVKVDVIGSVPLRPVLVDVETGEPFPHAFGRRRASDAWTLAVARLPLHRRFVVAGLTEDGATVTARMRAPHPPYRRVDPILISAGRYSIEFERRDPAMSRAIRQAMKRLSRGVVPRR